MHKDMPIGELAPGSLEGTRSATGSEAGAADEMKRWSAGRKKDVERRGEPVDAISREVPVPIYNLEQWRDRAAGIDTGLKKSENDPVRVRSGWAATPQQENPLMDGTQTGGEITEISVQPQWPRWIQQIQQLLPIRSQFVLSENIRDLFPVPVQGHHVLMNIVDCLHHALTARGIVLTAVYDKMDGVRLYPDTSDAREDFARLSPNRPDPKYPMGLETLRLHLRSVVCATSIRCAFVIDYASRLVARPDNLSGAEVDFFNGCAKLADIAVPLVSEAGNRSPLFNPVLWLFDQASDVPRSFSAGNERVYSLAVPKPDFSDRIIAAELLAGQFFGFSDARDKYRENIESFADQTAGLSLRSLHDIAQFARDQKIPFARISEAIRRYKAEVLGCSPAAQRNPAQEPGTAANHGAFAETQALTAFAGENTDFVCCPNADCERENRVDAERCHYCNRPMAKPLNSSGETASTAHPCAELEWPWGSMTLLNSLPVGRDENFSPLAALLADDIHLSRRHAEIGIEDGRFYVLDVGSRCGTFVNGTRIPVHNKTFVDDAATIRFGSITAVTVQLKTKI